MADMNFAATAPPDEMADATSRASPHLLTLDYVAELDPTISPSANRRWRNRSAHSAAVRRQYPDLYPRMRPDDGWQVLPLLPAEPLAQITLPEAPEGPFQSYRIMHQGGRRPLDLHSLHDVHFLYTRRGYAIFDAGGLSDLSTALPRIPARRMIRTLPAERIETGFYAGDIHQCGNIAHGVLDHVGRGCLVRSLAPPLGEMLLPGPVAPYTRHFADRLLPGWRQLEPDRLYHFATLHIASNARPSVEHPGRFGDPRLIGFLQSLPEAEAAGGWAGDWPERLYVSRRDAVYRSFDNEAELSQMLARRGFATVAMSEHPPAVQLALFRRAKVIVAQHGAALTGLAQCRPGTKVVELFHPKLRVASFAILAQAMGLDHRWLMPPAVGGGWNQHADLAAIAAALDA